MSISNIDDPDLEALEQGNHVEQAVALILRYGGIGGEHHKQWVLDQVLRILAGTAYEGMVHLMPGYSWSEGIAPRLGGLENEHEDTNNRHGWLLRDRAV